MNCDTPIFSSSSLSNEVPISVLFTQVESSGIRNKDEGEEASDKAEPAYYPKSCSSIDIIVDNCG